MFFVALSGVEMFTDLPKKGFDSAQPDNIVALRQPLLFQY